MVRPDTLHCVQCVKISIQNTWTYLAKRHRNPNQQNDGCTQKKRFSFDVSRNFAKPPQPFGTEGGVTRQSVILCRVMLALVRCAAAVDNWTLRHSGTIQPVL